MARVNPFKPHSPVSPGMFVGRVDQLKAMEQSLIQTRARSPKNFMLTGERGIGKSSLLRYFKHVAQGRIQVQGEKVNFLVIEADIDEMTTVPGFIAKIQLALERELAKTEQARAFMARAWDFIKRIEAGGFALKEQQPNEAIEVLLDQFAHSLASTANRICDPENKTVFGTTYDGVVLLIDEADNAKDDLPLGAMLKLLSERLQKHECECVMVGLAGLTGLRGVLRASHPSSLRLFEELPVDTLSPEEVGRVIDRALEHAEQENKEETRIDDAARAALISFAEGYPHFIQQFGYCAFAADEDGLIDIEDVKAGAFGERGAMELIGDAYYRDDFYNKIQKDSYRQVLRIMA